MAMPVTDDDIRRSQLRRMGLESDLKEQELAFGKQIMMAKGGPVTGKYTKGTGAVNIEDWTAPMKSRGAR